MRAVATAGHVDHGKSSLVRALTGTDPDRLPEEHARGLTIDLGFAFTRLPSGTEVGFVDVPGHVRFIKNMLAGVGGVDVALFVVAAPEGWMPQSEEHLQILELLGVGHGMVALTKADLVDDEVLELAQLEVEERIEHSPLAGAPIVACDSVSGRGIDDVRATLDGLLAGIDEPRDVGRPRLWIDRVFTVKGSGTVVTGTLTGGALSIDEEVEVAPRRARVRGIQVAGRAVTAADPGTRVALNLAGIDHTDVARGDAVVKPGQWSKPSVVDVALTVLEGAELRRRAALQAYVGSGEHRVRLRVLDEPASFARLRFDDAMPLAPGDHLVLRDPGRGRTVAGAVVHDLDPAGRARDAPKRLTLPLGDRLLASHPWLDVGNLPRLGGLSDDAAAVLVEEMVAAGRATRTGPWLVSSVAIERLRADVAEEVRRSHLARPLEPGVDVTVLAAAHRVTPAQLRAALAGAADLAVTQGVVHHRSHAGQVADSAEGRRVTAALEAAGCSPPPPTGLGADASLVRALVREGALVDLDGVVFAAAALDAARARVIDAMREHGHVTVADVRDLLGSSRKYVLPIVGWLDRTGVTRRRGDDRVPGPASGLT